MPADLWGKYPGAPVYVCTGPKAATSWKHRLDDDTVPLAGREEEVKLLSKYLEETGLEKINSGPVVHLLGDPGTGKSKLLQAFLANVKQRNRNLTVIELAGSSYGGRPGRLLLEFMDEWANEGLRPTGAKDSDRRLPGSPAAKIRLHSLAKLYEVLGSMDYKRSKQTIACEIRTLAEFLRKHVGEREAEACRRLMAKLAEDCFSLAVVGQFKRGKSSLMNAIIGRDILPTGVPPLTSAITVLKYGPKEKLTILEEGAVPEEAPVSSLAEYVTERGNPGSRKKMARACLRHLGMLIHHLSFREAARFLIEHLHSGRSDFSRFGSELCKLRDWV